MNVEIPSEVMGAEKGFLEELFQKIEYCNLSLIDMSSDIKHFSVDVSNIFPNIPFNVQIEIDNTRAVIYYGIGFSVREVYFTDPKAVKAFNDFFDAQRDNNYDARIYFLEENFSE